MWRVVVLILCILGTILGLIYSIWAVFFCSKKRDESETVAHIVLSSTILGFSLLGLIAFIIE